MEEIIESGAAPEESKKSNRDRRDQKKGEASGEEDRRGLDRAGCRNLRVEYCVLLFHVHDPAADHHFSAAPYIWSVPG